MAAQSEEKGAVWDAGVDTFELRDSRLISGTSEVKPAPDPVAAEHALAELAVKRQRNVRRYLIKEKDDDINRISECRSTYESADQGSPRVEIYLLESSGFNTVWLQIFG